MLGFGRIRKTLGEDLLGLWEGFMGIQGRLWERIHVDLWGRGFAIHKDSRDFGRGFMGIRETLEEDLWGFVRLWERICGDLQGFMRLWERIHVDS